MESKTSSPHIEVRPLAAALGAEVAGLDPKRVSDPEVFPAIHAAWLEHQVLVLRGLALSPEDQVAFAAQFGEVQVHALRRAELLAREVHGEAG